MSTPGLEIRWAPRQRAGSRFLVSWGKLRAVCATEAEAQRVAKTWRDAQRGSSGVVGSTP